MRRQGRIRCIMGQIVANVGKEAPLGFYALHDAQRILHCRMRGMRLMPQCIQEENVQSLQLMERRLGNLAMISEISGVAETEAVNLRLAVNQAHWLEACPKSFHGTIYRPKLELGQASVHIIGVKDVGEHTTQKSRRIPTRIKRQLCGLVTVTERSQIV